MMKKLHFTMIATLLMVVLLSSCSLNGAYVFNHNANSTQVHLAENNYQVVERVSGQAEVSYVLIFGGLNKKQLYADAYNQMVDEANLENRSRALSNIMTEERVGGVPPFFYTRTITVSAHVIEFDK